MSPNEVLRDRLGPLCAILVVIAVLLLCTPAAPSAKTVPVKLDPEGQLEDDPYIILPPAADLSCGAEWRAADVQEQGGVGERGWLTPGGLQRGKPRAASSCWLTRESLGG